MSVFDIPIIARGRCITPGEDAIEFGGRTGARFRAPNPHRHINDLVLHNPVLLQDLHDLPTREVIDFLVRLGERLALTRNLHMQQAYELALTAGGLTEPVLRRVYEQLPAMFDRTYLTQLVERTVGIRYLDGWVPCAEASEARVRLRAIGTRQLHITAGNVPVVAALTIIRSALTKSDCLIKSPSNDPLTASAIARTMLELDAEHPVTRHVAVAYWKGGDEFMDAQICRLSRIDKITAWGGQASIKHIQKYLVPGLDLIAMNPKHSMSVIGREALENAGSMREAAMGVAVAAGIFNQTACSSTRVVYVESDTDEASLDKVIAFGKRIHAALQALPAAVSTPSPTPNRALDAELRALELEEETYWVVGDSIQGGVIVSRFSDRVDCFGELNNRIVNLVPMPNLLDIVRWCDDSTQTVGVYPESLRERLLDPLALAGVQRLIPLCGGSPMQIYQDIQTLPAGMPHDGIEPMRRGVRWVIDQRAPMSA